MPAQTDEHRVLIAEDMVNGIGRKATDKELIEYLLKGESSEKIDFDIKTDEHRVLTDDDVAFGFGRQAIDAELRDYLEATEENDEGNFISIDKVRAQF